MQIGISIAVGAGAGAVKGNGTPVTETVIAADTYNRANGALTTTETGGFTYVFESSPWNVSSNQAALSAGTSHTLFNTTTADNYAAEVKFSALGSSTQRWVFRSSMGVYNNYWYLGKISATQYQLAKRVTGTTTVLQLIDVIPAAGDLLRVEVRGTNIIAKINGNTVANVNDSFNQSATGFGYFVGDLPCRFDDMKIVAI